MSRTRAYSDETIQVISRFFEAVDAIIADGRIRGIQTYCRLANIDKRHFYAQRADLHKGYFEVSWFMPLVKYFRLNLNWLIMGKGEMFQTKLTYIPEELIKDLK